MMRHRFKMMKSALQDIYQKGFVVIVVVVALSSVCFADLTLQEMSEIQAGMQCIPVFKDLPLGGNPGDIVRHWESLRKLSTMSAWDAIGRMAFVEKLSQDSFRDLKTMNKTLADPTCLAQFTNVEARRAFAARYYHLLYFIYQYYRFMGWSWDSINSDFTDTGWSDAAEYKWQANAAKMREWLGVSTQMPAAEMSSPTSQQSNGMGVRSVRDVEAAIRRQQSWVRELERKLQRANEDYSRHNDTKDRLYANRGVLTDKNGMLGQSYLRSVHANEKFLRDAERNLEQLYNELEVAKAREEAARAHSDQQRTDRKNAANDAYTEKSQDAQKSDGRGVGMRFCTECGTQVRQVDKFCGSCGNKL